MTEQSFVFDMTLIETFWDNWNKADYYGKDTMTGTGYNYEIILANSSSTNPLNTVSDAIENGAIKSTVNIHEGNVGQVNLEYTGTSGTWERTISFKEDSVITISNNISIKAVFLRNVSTKKVLAYCILSNSVPVTNKITIPKDTVIWRIKENVKE